MKYVDPIKDIGQIDRMKKVLRESSLRDYVFFVTGINTGISVSELLQLTVGDVWDGSQVRDFLRIREGRKEKVFYLNSRVKEAIKEYIEKYQLKQGDYLFPSRKDHLPISRQQAYRIIKSAARKAGVTGRIGTHSLRKTFGYHAYVKGVAISLLMTIFNHHSPNETLQYIGIDKNDPIAIRIDVNL